MASCRAWGGPDEDREGGIDHGPWSASYGDEVLARQAGEGIGQTSAYLFGPKTCEHMAAHCPRTHRRPDRRKSQRDAEARGD